MGGSGRDKSVVWGSGADRRELHSPANRRASALTLSAYNCVGLSGSSQRAEPKRVSPLTTLKRPRSHFCATQKFSIA